MSKPSKGLIFSLSSSFLWAIYIVLTRFLLKAGENPLNLTLWSNVSTAFFFSVIFIRHFKGFLALSGRYKLLLVAIGISASLGLNLLQNIALQNTSATNFAFLYRMIVVFTIFFAWIFFREKITKSKIILAVTILIGSYLLTTNGQGLVFTKGDVYTLLMAACGAFIANILIKHTMSKMHPDLSGSVISFVTVATLLTVSVGSQTVTVPSHLWLIFLGGLISFLQIATRNRAYKIVSASYITMIVSLTPVFVTVMSYFLLGEKLEPVQIVGGIMIVSSGILAEKLKI